MKLTENQKLALAQRVYSQFAQFITEELEYQVEDMKDQDQLAWEYHLTSEDREGITELIVDMVAVPVS